MLNVRTASVKFYMCVVLNLTKIILFSITLFYIGIHNVSGARANSDIVRNINVVFFSMIDRNSL